MRKRITTLAAAGAVAISMLGLGASPALGAHCTDNGGPGHSDFASHVRANNGPGDHNEGMHKGWASCNAP